MIELCNCGMCPVDGVVLVPVVVTEDGEECPLSPEQCQLCERVYVQGWELNVIGCEVQPLTPRVVE